jgi:hypothetical protein
MLPRRVAHEEGGPMTEVKEQGDIPSKAPEVWALVRDFGGFVEMLGVPVELEGEGIGTRRKMTLGSDTVVERLDELDDGDMRVRYSILEAGPLPVREYQATMQLAEGDGDSCTLTWSSTFEPAGTSEEDAVTAVQRVYRGGIKALQRHFGPS